MQLQKVAHLLRRILTPISWWSLIVGGVGLVIMMATVVVDITMRSVSSMALRGAIDIVEICLTIVLFCGVAFVELKREHITVTVLTERFSARVQQVIVVTY